MTIRGSIDTCVSWGLAQDGCEQLVIAAPQDRIESSGIELIVQQQVLNEFDPNKARICKEGGRSLQARFRLARQPLPNGSLGVPV